MKRLIIYIFFVGGFLLSCTNDFEPQIYGSLSPTTFPSNAAEYELYVMELYKPFQAKWGYQGVEWENNWFCPEYGHLVMFDASTDLMPVYTAWGSFWEGFSSCDFNFLKTQGRSSHFEKVRMITRATKIISDLENSDINENVRNQLLGEAHMARGWSMYYLLHMYGPVPVLLNSALIGDSIAESNLTRPSRESFVSAIETDLQFASDNLPQVAKNYGRFTKGTALTVLMRLFLNEKNFTKAETVGREILPLGYKLVDDYRSLFLEASEVNNETIWAVSCSNGNETQNFNAFAFYCYPPDYEGFKVKGGWSGNGNGVFSIAWSFYDQFDINDTRRQLLIPEYTGKQGIVKNRTNMKGAIIAKYPDEGGAENSLQGNDIVVCRYADVLLMLAEAINENNGPTAEAIAYVNQIRQRAHIGALTELETKSKEALRDAIFTERGKELYFEGLRKFDLIRMNKWESALKAAGKTPGPQLFPVPDYAVNNSNGQLMQTPGYE